MKIYTQVEEYLKMNQYELKIMVEKEVLLGLLGLKMKKIDYLFPTILVIMLIYLTLITIEN